MPAKILLADKSITIQKVVEMLFSGRDYEVVCVSDGETALNEAARVAPDVVLADVDLPRVDGYGIAMQLKQIPLLARTPVILMMSRDDVYDTAKGKQAGIVDNIAKPFESQELIGKVKKALAAAPAKPAQPAAHPAAGAPQPPQPPAPSLRPAPSPVPPPPPSASVKQATPSEIFEILQEAPTESEIRKAALPAPAGEESVYEVEPEVEEVEEPLAREIAKSLPVGDKAVEEIRAGLGLTGKGAAEQPEAVPLESFDLAMESETTVQEPALPKPPAVEPAARPAPLQPTVPESELRKMAEEAVMKMAKEAFEKVPLPQPPTIPAEELRRMAEETIAKMAKEAYAKVPPPQPLTISPSELWTVAEETVSKMAKEMFEQMPPVQPPQVSDEAVRRLVEEKVSAMAQEALGKIETPKTPSLSEGELRDMAEKIISKMAEEVINKMPPPPLPKISDDTVRRGLEVVLSKIAREMAKEVFEQVAWEVIPPLAEHLIKEEIEKLKAMQ